MSDKPTRVIIGSVGQAGLPITADAIQHHTAPPRYTSGMRWVQHGTHFALEAFNGWNGHWEEVPCVVMGKEVAP